ncbi:MAG: deoxyuridine 5'-triphosphate nucleotidohydrolase [Dehalococcoidia bacterium]|nr:deoxyuridine 5'-triphosphate nucleotidohydrolase [Dehalococcoidia bacterium]
MNFILTHKDILARLASCPPLVEGYLNLELQMQNNGFDITLRTAATFTSPGQLALDNNERTLPHLLELEFGEDELLTLPPGQYRIVYNEIVHLPKDVIAFGFPRSSLLRCGADMRTAVWDAGYSGRSESLLVVHNPHGLRLKRQARLLQLVFLQLGEESDGYHGAYQNENT